jgi:hypothetical protein
MTDLPRIQNVSFWWAASGPPNMIVHRTAAEVEKRAAGE